MKFPKKLNPVYIVLGLIVVVAIIAIPAISSLFGGLSSFFKKAGSMVTEGTDKLAGLVGLDKEANEIAAAGLVADVSSPWNPDFYKNSFIPDNYSGLSITQMQGIDDALKSARGFFSFGSMDSLLGIFQTFQSKAQFSEFCDFWYNTEGDSFAGWLQSPTIALMRGVISNADFKELDTIVQKLPDYTTD